MSNKIDLQFWLISFRYNSSNIFITLMDNQFINAPLLVNKSAYTDHKDELIRKLKAKNIKLKTQLVKIQKAIEERFGNQQQETGPKKRQSIFAHQDSFQVLSKELSNTYKRIKMYEYEVNKLENPDKSINVSQKTSQYQAIIKEKKTMASKLKIKLIRENKLVQDNIKKLGGNSQKEELETHMRKMTEEAKFYKNKLKTLEGKEQLKAGNMKKQYQAIKRIQTQLIQGGLAGGQLEQIKRKAVNSVKVNPNNPARSTMQQTKKGHKHDDFYMSGSEEQIQDKTRQHYDALLAEVTLLEKMQNDHEKQMVKAYDEKIESINKNMQSRNRLLQCQNEIQNLEKQIQVIKGKVIPSNLKPTKPLRSLSSHQGQNPNKLLPAKYIGVTPMKTKPSHQLTKINNTSKLHQQS